MHEELPCTLITWEYGMRTRTLQQIIKSIADFPDYPHRGFKVVTNCHVLRQDNLNNRGNH
jgi:hypothetical protein